MLTFIVAALMTKRLLIRTYCCILDDSTIGIPTYCLIVVCLGWYLAINYFYFFDSISSYNYTITIFFLFISLVDRLTIDSSESLCLSQFLTICLSTSMLPFFFPLMRIVDMRDLRNILFIVVSAMSAVNSSTTIFENRNQQRIGFTATEFRYFCFL